MRLTLKILLIHCVTYVSLFSQIFLTEDICEHIDNIITSLPTGNGTGEYQQPNEESRNLWRQIIQYMLEENYAEAHSLAQQRNYQVGKVEDPQTGHHYWILERAPSSTSRFWGTYVFNPDAKRPNLIIQTPHPVNDRNTGNLGIRLFKNSSAGVYFVSGTHRCNGASDSPCDGFTSACSEESAPYRYSDMAHVVLGPFHVATEVLYENNPEIVIIQPHGFTKGSEDPHIILSNGTRYESDNTDHLRILRDNLALVDPRLTFKTAHLNLDWTRLIATTNTQGRLLNNSGSPCNSPALSASGQFLHLEMAYSGLRDTEENWSKLTQAVLMTFPVQEESDSNRYFLRFDGVDDYVLYNHGTSIKAFDNSSSYTVEASFRTDWKNVDEYDRILDLQDQFSLYIKQDKSFVFAVYAPSSTYYYHSLPGVLLDDEWNHVAISRFNSDSGFRLRLFLNGENVTADTTKIGSLVPLAPQNPRLFIGHRSNYNNGFQGDIDRIRITAKALYEDIYPVIDMNIIDVPAPESFIALNFNGPEDSHIAENKGWVNTFATLGNSLENDSAQPEWVNHSHVNRIYSEPSLISDGYELPAFYPNPFNNMVTLRLKVLENIPVHIHIIDLQGKPVFIREYLPYSSGFIELPFDFSGKSSGIYVYRIIADSRHFSGKLLYMK